MIAIPDRIPDVPAASISTGGNIVSGATYDVIAADMVDMETYSVLRAARLRRADDRPPRHLGRPQRPDRPARLDEFLHILDEKLALVLDDFAGHVAEGRFRPGAGDTGASG